VTVPARGRDRAIDVLRGVFIVLMVSTHISDESVIQGGLHLQRWFTGAEGFVMLSGLVLGMVHQRRVARLGDRAASILILRRAATLYSIQVALCVVVVVAAVATGRPSSVPPLDALGGIPGTAMSVALLRFQPNFLNVLPMYVVFLLAAPAVLWAARRNAVAVLAASMVLWAASQVLPRLGQLSDPVFGDDAFRLPAWQLLFVLGLVIGSRGDDLASRLRRDHRAMVVASAVTLVALIGLAQLDRPSIGAIHVPPELTSRPDLGPVRLAEFLVFVVVALAVLGWLRDRGAFDRGPLAVPADWLGSLGSRSLASFQLLTVLVIGLVVAGVKSWPDPAVELTTLVVMAILFIAARNLAATRLIPN